MNDTPTKNPGLGGSYVVLPDGELELRERTRPADETAAPATASTAAAAEAPAKRSILRRATAAADTTTENQEG